MIVHNSSAIVVFCQRWQREITLGSSNFREGGGEVMKCVLPVQFCKTLKTLPKVLCFIEVNLGLNIFIWGEIVGICCTIISALSIELGGRVTYITDIVMGALIRCTSQ